MTSRRLSEVGPDGEESSGVAHTRCQNWDVLGRRGPESGGTPSVTTTLDSVGSSPDPGTPVTSGDLRAAGDSAPPLPLPTRGPGPAGTRGPSGACGVTTPNAATHSDVSLAPPLVSH